MKSVILVHSTPQPWGHPTGDFVAEHQALPAQQREQMERDFEQLLTEMQEAGEFLAALLPGGPDTPGRRRPDDRTDRGLLQAARVAPARWLCVEVVVQPAGKTHLRLPAPTATGSTHNHGEEDATTRPATSFRSMRRTARCGTTTRSPAACALSRRRWCVGRSDPSSCRRRSRRSTVRRRRLRRPTGRRSSCSTGCCCASRPRRSSSSTSWRRSAWRRGRWPASTPSPRSSPDPTLARGHRVHAVHAHLLEMASRREEACAAYLLAASRTQSIPEQRYLIGRASESALP